MPKGRIIVQLVLFLMRFHVLSDNAVGYRPLALGFKSRVSYVSRVFHLSLCLITLENYLAHLAYYALSAEHENIWLRFKKQICSVTDMLTSAV